MKTILRVKRNNILNTQMLLEMAKVGDLNNQLVIYIWTREGDNMPHFHIVDKTTMGSKFNTHTKIEAPEYFHHTEKEGVLNSKQKKSLVEFFNKSDKCGDNY